MAALDNPLILVFHIDQIPKNSCRKKHNQTIDNSGYTHRAIPNHT